jgi:hypothetical protein
MGGNGQSPCKQQGHDPHVLFTEVLDGKLIEHVMCRRCGEIWERPK